jgi:type I restriction enzyme, S subunit
MSKYQEYKNTTLDWIDEIPAHWDVLPNIALFRERNEKGFDDLQLLAVTIKRGIITQRALLENSVKKDSSNDDKSNYKRVCVGDLAYNKMRMWQGAVGASDYEGIVSPAYIILVPNINIDSRYYHYLFRTNAYTEVSYRNSYGIHDDQLSLRYKDFKRMYSIVPPYEEQKKISSFLDGKMIEIDTIIDNIEKEVNLLEEYWNTTIFNTVTKGLNRSSGYKKSTLEWIDEIPAHWDVLPNIALFRERNEKGFEDLPLLAVTIKKGIITQQDLLENSVKKDSSNDDKSNYKRVCVGDLAYNKMRMWQGAVGASGYEGIVSPAYIILSPKSPVNPRYFHYLFRTKIYNNYSYQHSYGIHDDQLSLRYDDFKRMYSIVPPFEEQNDIVEYLDDKHKLITKLLENRREQIRLLEEYRESLTIDAVSGRVKINDHIKGSDIDANKYVGTRI